MPAVLHAQKAGIVKREYTERRAAYDKTIVLTDEKVPNSCIMTYFRQGVHYTDANLLLKIMPAFEVDGEKVMMSGAQDISVEDFPGGVVATFRVKNIRVETRIRPLLVGKETDVWDGAALYDISTSPHVPVTLYLGGGKTLAMDHPEIRAEKVSPLRDLSVIDTHSIQFKSGEENMPVLVKSSGLVKTLHTASGTGQVTVALPSGAGHLLLAYADQPVRLSAIGKMDSDDARKEVDRYYAQLLGSSHVQTPDTAINAAFRSAIYNLEYTWIQPYGWMECLHHWYALFQQQVSAAAEWIGQADRSRQSILEQATHLMQDDNVPQFMPDGLIKRDFGGSNQYWAWQIRHYLAFTGDTAFAKQIIPYLDTVIAETVREHDKDGDQLFSWGLQIGNQEDFIGTPGDGTVPSIEMANMYRTRAGLAALVGEKKDAALYEQKAAFILKQLHARLWLGDLGRYAYFNDLTDNLRLDGQYETYLYPIIWDAADPLDQYTGLRHLLDRLTGNDGSVFCSNNFSWHSIGTWGMQNCEAQQPWAAWAFSKYGLNNLTWRPLKAMADWAMDINHRGAWPEMSVEATPGYFTPPAGLYIASTIEALFGLKVNTPEHTLEISPSFPDAWPSARLTLPEFKADYHREGNVLTYTLETSRTLEQQVRWRLPPAEIARCLVNGKKADYSIEPGVGHIILHIDHIHSRKTKIVIEYKPLQYELSYSHSIAEGDTLQLTAKGISIDRIDDRCKVLSSQGYGRDSTSFVATIQKGLLAPYARFGRLGQLNFSRRTFFIHGRLSQDLSLWLPVDLTILPRFEATALHEIEKAGNGYSIQLQIRNNTNSAYEGPALLRVHEQEISFELKVSPHAETETTLQLPENVLSTLSPGDNNASLCLQDNSALPVVLTLKKTAQEITSGHLVNITLPAQDLMPDTLWNTLRVMPGFPHIFFTFSNYGWPKPMTALADSTQITVPEIPGLVFRIPHRAFVPVSHTNGKVAYRLSLPPGVYKKIYLLVLPFVDNHDMFTTAARVTAYANNEIVYQRSLSYPGDLDYWVPDVNPTAFSTYREPRPDRFGLLPLLKPDQADWAEGKPPAFPESKYWSSSIPVVTRSCLMNVVELDLNSPTKLDYLVFESVGDYVAFGIVGAAGEVEENK